MSIVGLLSTPKVLSESLKSLKSQVFKVIHFDQAFFTRSSFCFIISAEPGQSFLMKSMTSRLSFFTFSNSVILFRSIGVFTIEFVVRSKAFCV